MTLRGASSRRAAPWLWLAALLIVAWLLWPRSPGVEAPAIRTAPAAGAADPGPAPSPPVADASPAPSADTGTMARLPAEARRTVRLIHSGGPFPHAQDGSVFGNREGHLPRQPRGWYREYTVETPGLRHRGARRIVTGGDPPQAWYYTDDHYETFRRFDPGAPRP